MPGKFDKFKDIFAIAEPIAKAFVPGSIGSVLDEVNNHLTKPGNGPAPAGTADAIKALAADNDAQTQAILALNERLKAVEAKLK